MPIIIFINSKGKFVQSSIASSSGWWQTIFVDDVNNDGHKDILAGNWGWNNKFWNGKNGPVKIYVNDFDKNGQTDQLLSYTKDGREYPFLAKDEVERCLPLLRKHYLLYSEYAGVVMKDVFYGWIDTVKPYVAEQLGSAICYGDGKGGFILNELPAELQLSPIFSFQKIQMTGTNAVMYISGGNFFDVIPYEGRYDAQPLAFFKVDNKNKVHSISHPGIAAIKGQVRDIKWLNTFTAGNILAVARNNDSLIFLKNDGGN
jgi:hypothetical protein